MVSNSAGAGSDGSSYWALFNIEGESAVGADYVTYATLDHMLTNSNRLDTYTVNGFGRNIVGTGSDAMRAVAVPEPASWAMLIGGFGLAGATMRRRRAPVRVFYA